MVIVRLKGGIGNQLFQFAFGRAIAEHRKEQLYFDLTYLTKNPLKFTHSDFKLNKLSNVLIADQVLLQDFGTLFELGNAAFISDEHAKRAVLKIINNPQIKAIMLDGYYKDEDYQLNYVELIKNEIRALLNKYFNMDIAKLLIYREQESVCVNLCYEKPLLPTTAVVNHVNRYDYYQLNRFDFYKEAIFSINQRLENPHFYIFSDNSRQAEELFASLSVPKTNISAIINHMPSMDNDLIELAIMSQCKHFIMADCSYSWWGAYLSSTSNKIVIKPHTFSSRYYN
jgi:hypothetical protein